jgi:hypothetical protein
MAMKGSARLLIGALAAAALALPAAAAANPVEGHYTGHTTHGGYPIDLHYREHVVHDFRFNGHLTVAHMSVVHNHFEGRNSAGRLIYGAFRSDGEAVGSIATVGNDNQIAYHWHVKPVAHKPAGGVTHPG